MNLTHDGTDDAMDIVRDLAACDPEAHNGSDIYCTLYGKDNTPLVHLDSCPWVRARALVK